MGGADTGINNVDVDTGTKLGVIERVGKVLALGGSTGTSGAGDALETPWRTIALGDERLDLGLLFDDVDLGHALEDAGMVVTHLENNDTGVDAWARLEEDGVAVLVELEGIHVLFNWLWDCLIAPPGDNVLLEFSRVVGGESVLVDEALVGGGSKHRGACGQEAGCNGEERLHGDYRMDPVRGKRVV